MDQTKINLDIIRCDKCGRMIGRIDRRSMAYFEIMCQNRHCGYINPVWYDGTGYNELGNKNIK